MKHRHRCVFYIVVGEEHQQRQEKTLTRRDGFRVEAISGSQVR
ncbi:MAG: hypothetical protein K0R82_687 [Flavipsychrobacter sp.]|jgi:hypothetical protein|nr:hypothetical protein [Flavipsychrobacter sp.]